MRILGNKLSGILGNRNRQYLSIFIVFLVVVLYIEFISYILNTRHWPSFTITGNVIQTSRIDLEANEVGKPFDLRGVEPLRILLVADPQIIGENEHRYYGPIAIWDADRYLQQNYNQAKSHVQPNVVVFLGDLMNEGIVAYDQQYRRYFKRFANIFQLPKRSDPSSIEYVYLPGDNDVGGEDEPVDPVKLKWFNITYGDYHHPFRIREEGWDIQFLKLWTLDFKRTHVNNPDKSKVNPKTQIVVSHLPLLKFTTSSVQRMVDEISPSLILSAHDHHSSIYSYDKGLQKGITYIPDFLQRQSNESVTKKARLNPGSTLYEITVPTCSYRMGTKEMGFGTLEIYKNGTIDYSVLWLESRFKYLYSYAIIYILLKIILARWILWRLWCALSSRCYNYMKRRQPHTSTC